MKRLLPLLALLTLLSGATALLPAASRAAPENRAPARLNVTGPTEAGVIGGEVTWRARLTSASGAPIRGAKLVLTYNHEENRAIVATTDAGGYATFRWPLVGDNWTSCCVANRQYATRYPIRIRFEGDASSLPTSADFIQPVGVENGTAAPRLVIEQAAPELTSGSPLVVSALLLRADGSPLTNRRIEWNSADLGQRGNCQTGSDGRCQVTLATVGRGPGDFGISATFLGDSEAPPAAAATVLHLSGGSERAFIPHATIYHWRYSWEFLGANTLRPIGAYWQTEWWNLVSGYDSQSNTARLKGDVVRQLADQIGAQQILDADWRARQRPLALAINFETNKYAAPGQRPANFGDWVELSCNGTLVSVPPFWDATFRERWATIPAAFRQLVEQRPGIVSISYGGGADAEWANMSWCKNQLAQAAGLPVWELEAQWRSFERLNDSAWSAAFAGTDFPILTQGMGRMGAAGQPHRISPRYNFLPDPDGLRYYQHDPTMSAPLITMRMRNVAGGCERRNSVEGGGALTRPDFGPLTTAQRLLPARWNATWRAIAYAVHMRCAQLDLDQPGWYDAFEVEGQATIPNFGQFVQAHLGRSCETMGSAVWWAHDAARGYRKGDNGSWNSDIYGDLDGCLYRREAEPTTPLSYDEVPMPARVDYFVSGTGVRSWGSMDDWGTPRWNPRGGIAISARRGERFVFDIDDGLSARAQREHWRLRLVFLANGGGPVTISWPSGASSTTSATVARGSDNRWQTVTLPLSGFVPRTTGQSAAFAAHTDIEVRGSGLVLTFAEVGPAVGDPPNPPPTVVATATPSPTPPTATATVSATPPPGASATPTATATAQPSPTPETGNRTVILYPQRDTEIRASQPDANLGTDPLMALAEGEASALLAFDTRAIPEGATVQYATLVLWPEVWNEQPMTLVAHHIARAWDESSATWRLARASEPWQLEGAGGTRDIGARVGRQRYLSPGNVGIVVTDAVNDWVTRRRLNFGLRLSAEGTGTLTFHSRNSNSFRARLYVTYTPPGQPPFIPPLQPIPAAGLLGLRSSEAAQQATWYIDLANRGGGGPVVVTAELPTGARVVSASEGGESAGASTVRWSVEMGPGESRRLLLTLQVPSLPATLTVRTDQEAVSATIAGP